MLMPRLVALSVIGSCILFGESAYADRRLELPDGGGCWVNDVGFVYGCSGGSSSGVSNSGVSSSGGSIKGKKAWSTKGEWKQCERLKDWPGHPSNCDHLLP